MNIAVVGSREFKDKKLIEDMLKRISYGDVPFTLVSGGARGVDTFAEQIVKTINSKKVSRYQHHKIIIFKPNWNKYGKSAGFIRNQSIIDEADKVIAFWNGKSKGTKHSIDLAIKANKPVDIYIRT